MKLNLGCGNHYADGWVNVDRTSNHEVHPDVEGDLRDLDLQGQPVERVYMGHVLEHLPLEDVVPFLTDLRGMLPPGTPVCVVGPDVGRAQAFGPEVMAVAGAGGERWDGDRHHWDCHLRLVGEMLWDAGYTGVKPIDIADVPDDWPVVSRVGWQCAVLATT